MNARERRFMDALRGPAGETVRWDGAIASSPAELSVGRTIVDSFHVTYEGHEQPITIFMDAYHYGWPMAPAGFTCGKPFALQPPPVDPFRATESLVRLAIEQGASREFAPITLSAGDVPRVETLDQFRVVAFLAHAAAAAGMPFNPARPPTQGGTALLAFAQHCDGQTISATSIDIIPSQGPPPTRGGPLLNETTVGTTLPGFQLPPTTLVATYGLGQLRPTDIIRVSYADAPCANAPKAIDVKVTISPIRPLQSPLPRLPSAHAPVDEPVLLQALVDMDGKVQHPIYIGGPEDLATIAIEAVRDWKAEPARMNGAPIVMPAMIPVRFAAASQ
jgi:hypothetical protein